MRRDATQLGQNDTFGVLLDTFHDRRDGVLFYTNALGALGRSADHRRAERQRRLESGVGREDRRGSTAAGRRDARSRSSRCAIVPGAAQTWGIQLRRVVRRLNEWSYLTPVPISAAGRDGSQGILRVSQAATLVGLEVPPGSSNLEIKPYAHLGPDDRPRGDAVESSTTPPATSAWTSSTA